jgi:hypothetical protein
VSSGSGRAAWNGVCSPYSVASDDGVELRGDDRSSI